MATEAIKYIESHPPLKARLFNALKLGSAQALEEAINHPTARFVIAALEDWQKLDSPKYGSSSDIELVFLTEVLQAIQDSHGNSQVVYPLLQANLDKLNDSLTQQLHLWVTTILPRLTRIQVQRTAANIANFSTLIRQFPLGNKDCNVEIAITGYEIVAQVFTREAFPEQWAMLRNNLGGAYLERIRGERAENIERAISSISGALEVLTRQAFPEQWAITQNNLGEVYLERLQGTKAENLEKAIACFQAALEVYTRETFPSEWAKIQNNLGTAYSARIRGEREENLEQAISCYQAALQVYTRESFPESWVESQTNLGNAYRSRILGEQRENLELAIASYEQALAALQDTSDRYSQGKIYHQLGGIYKEQCEYEVARQNYEQALEIFIEQGDRLFQVDTYSQIGLVAQESGDYVEARRNLQQALELVTELGNRSDSAVALERLGDLESNQGNWKEAERLFQQALELREQLGDQQGLTVSLNRLGGVLQQQGRFDEAIIAFQRSVEISEQLDDKDTVKTILNNLNTVRQQLERWKEANLFTNPFIPQQGRVDNLQLFFDREREIRRVFEVLNSGSSVALIGEEGIGKSSLLWKICQQAENYLHSPRQAVLLDLNWVNDENDFYSALCHEVGIPESKDYSLTRNLRDRRILLAIDNVGKMTWVGFTRRVRERLRALAEGSNAPLKLILAASEPLGDVFNDSQDEGKTSPLAGICQEENIKSWNETIARAFIDARLAMSSLRFTEEEISQLVQESGGHPRRLMQLCHRTYSRYIESRINPLHRDEIAVQRPLSETAITYDVWLNISPETLSVGEELEVSVYISPLNADNNHTYLLEVPSNEVIGGELNIVLTTPSFQLDGDNAASLPLDSDTRSEISSQLPIQTARFRLTALRGGTATITAELYRGDTFETTLEAKVQVAGFDEASFTATRITTQPRPVPQPDFILRVQTAWKQTNSTCRFQYQLRSFRFPSLFPGETNYHSDSLSSSWIEQMRGLLGTTLENISDALPEDGRSHLTSLGQYLFQHLLPSKLQTDFRNLIPRERTFTLLILADQDASLPWELLHDGQRFLSARFIIGRWFWELNDTRPHEFPVGAINVAHYADVEQPELWTALLEPPGSPPPLPLPDGVLGNLNSTEAMRGLHLLRYSQSADAANRRNAPVTLDDTNNVQDIERQMRPAKLNLRRNRPLVSLGYVRRDHLWWCPPWGNRTELTTLEQTWASAFIRAGCSAFTGSLWAVDPAVEAVFISGFYNRLWTGDSLGEAFHASRQLARTVAPDSLDWLAYVLFGAPMARPYRPVEGKGYAVVEPIGREIDDPLPPDVPVRFRLSLRRTPPVWHEERVIEVAENLTFENLQAHVKTFGLQVTPDSPIAMSLAPTGNYLGWFTLVAPPEMVGNSALVQVFLMDGMLPIHSVMFSLNIENEEESSA